VVRNRFRSQVLRKLQVQLVDVGRLTWEQALILQLGACIRRRGSLNSRPVHEEAIRQRRLVWLVCSVLLFYLLGSRGRLAGVGKSCELRGTYRRRLP